MEDPPLEIPPGTKAIDPAAAVAEPDGAGEAMEPVARGGGGAVVVVAEAEAEAADFFGFFFFVVVAGLGAAAPPLSLGSDVAAVVGAGEKDGAEGVKEATAFFGAFEADTGGGIVGPPDIGSLSGIVFMPVRTGLNPPTGPEGPTGATGVNPPRGPPGIPTPPAPPKL